MGVLDDLRGAVEDAGNIATRGVRPGLRNLRNIGAAVDDPLADFGRSIGGGIRRATLDPLQGWNRREVRPRAFIFNLTIKHPEMIWDDQAFNYWVRREGVNPDAFGTDPSGRRIRMLPFGGYLAAGTWGSDVKRTDADLAAMDESLKKAPGWERFTLELAADPTSYIGVGAAAKASKMAFSAKLAEGVGFSEAIRAGAKVLGSEAFGLTGIPQGISAVRWTASVPLRTASKLAEVSDVIRGAEAARSFQLDKLRALAPAEQFELAAKSDELRLAAATEMKRLKPDVGKVQDLQQELLDIQGRLTGESLTRSDVKGLADIYGPTINAGVWVPPQVEFRNSVVHTIPEPSKAERIVGKNRVLNTLWKLGDRSIEAKGPEADVIKWADITRSQSLAEGEQRSKMAAGFLQQAGHEAFGGTYDPYSLVMHDAKFGGVDIYQVLGDAKYEKMLTPQQKLAKKALVGSLQEWARGTQRMLQESGAWEHYTAEEKRWVTSLGTKMENGDYFIPRSTRAMATGENAKTDFEAAMKERSAWRKITRTGPAGFREGRVTRMGLGARQSAEMNRILDTIDESERAVFSGDFGDIFQGYADELTRIAVDDAVITPILRQHGLTQSQILGKEFMARASVMSRQKGLAQMARQVATLIRRDGTVTGPILNSIKGLRRSDYIPGDAELALKDLEELGSLQVSRSPDLANRARAAAREMARVLKTGNKPNKALAAAAEAAATAGEDKIVKDYMKVAASVAEHELGISHARATAAIAEVNAAKSDITRLKNLSQGRRAVQGIPGLNGRYFDEKFATELERAFGIQRRSGFTSTVMATNAILQSLVAGFDASFVMIQNLAVLASNPYGWGKTLTLGVGSMVKPEIYAGYLNGLSKVVDPMSGRLLVEQIRDAKLAMASTELFAPSEAMSAIRASKTPLDGALRFVDHLPWNRGWAVGRNIGAIEMFRSQVGLEQAMLGRALTTDELQSVGRQVNLATGFVSMQGLGIGPNQQIVERTLGRFGVQWFRSQVSRLIQATNGGMDGRIARRLLMHQMGAMTIMYKAASSALGQDAHLNPFTKEGRFDTDFLTLNIQGNKVGFSTPYRSMMKDMIETQAALTRGDKTPLERMRAGILPSLKFWRSAAPIVGSFLADNIQAAAGVDRQNQLALDPISLQNLWDDPKQMQQVMLPFSVQSAEEAQGGPGTQTGVWGLGLLGYTVTPEFPTEAYRGVTQARAKELGFSSWDDIPQAQQDEIIRGDEELMAAQEARDKWLSRYPDRTDYVFKQVDDDRQAMEVTLGPLWERVQKGEVSKAEYRDVYRLAAQNHAKLTDSLMATLPENERRDPKTEQDQLAREYQGIQPESFTPDGVSPDSLPSGEREVAWDAWRAARQQFWSTHPEAEQYRQYITQEYPARNWQDQSTREAVLEKLSAQDSYDRFLQIPKYQGMSVEDGNFFDQAKSMMNALRDQSGISGKRGAALAYAQTLQLLQEQGANLTPGQHKALQLAFVAMLKPKVGAALRSGERTRFLTANPLIVSWYPSSVRDAGLQEDEALNLNVLSAPLGMSAAQRAEQLAS